MRRSLPAVLLAGGLLLLGASPAAASSTTGPATVTEHGEVALSGTIEEPTTERVTGVAELRLTGPGADAVPVARSARPTPQEPRRDPATVAFPLTTAPCNLPGDRCTGGAVLPNGSWTVQLFEVDRAAGAPDVERGEPTVVVVDVPALPPQDVTATLEGRTVTVAWARGVGPRQGLVEPDVRWTVDDGAGRTVAAGPEACTDGRCSVGVQYPGDASGSRTFTVSASRPGSAPATPTQAAEPVVVPAVPGAPSSSPSGAPGGGGTGQATAQSFTRGLGSFAPGLGLPTLPPPLPPPPVTAPQVADTFAPTLGFEDRSEVVPEDDVPEPQAAPGRESVLRSTGGPLGESAVRGVAGALVMLMAGAHLRTWLSTTRPTDL